MSKAWAAGLTPADDDGVRIPPRLARPLLRLLMAEVTKHVREDGVKGVPDDLRELLAALHAADQRMSPRGPAPETMVDVPGMARLLKVSSRHARRLLAKGAIRGVKVGRYWVVDPRDLPRREDDTDE